MLIGINRAAPLQVSELRSGSGVHGVRALLAAVPAD